MKTHVHDYFLTSFSNILPVIILISHPMVLFKPSYKARIIKKCLMSWNRYETCLFIKRRDLVVVKKIPSFFVSQRVKGYLYQSRKNEETISFFFRKYIWHTFLSFDKINWAFQSEKKEKERRINQMSFQLFCFDLQNSLFCSVAIFFPWKKSCHFIFTTWFFL